MSGINGRLNKLERGQAAADFEADKLADMSDADLLRNLARLQYAYEMASGYEPDYRLCPEVDALAAAGLLDEAWELLSNRPRPIETNLNEVNHGN